VKPATTNDSMTAAPALSLATTPMITKIPAPMMAPTPRLLSWSAPRTGLSVWPSASFKSKFFGFLAHSGLFFAIIKHANIPRMSRLQDFAASADRRCQLRDSAHMTDVRMAFY
jgi:hypothetical protein